MQEQSATSDGNITVNETKRPARQLIPSLETDDTAETLSERMLQIYVAVCNDYELYLLAKHADLDITEEEYFKQAYSIPSHLGDEETRKKRAELYEIWQVLLTRAKAEGRTIIVPPSPIMMISREDGEDGSYTIAPGQGIVSPAALSSTGGAQYGYIFNALMGRKGWCLGEKNRAFLNRMIETVNQADTTDSGSLVRKIERISAEENERIQRLKDQRLSENAVYVGLTNEWAKLTEKYSVNGEEIQDAFRNGDTTRFEEIREEREELSRARSELQKQYLAIAQEIEEAIKNE